MLGRKRPEEKIYGNLRKILRSGSFTERFLVLETTCARFFNDLPKEKTPVHWFSVAFEGPESECSFAEMLVFS